MILTCPSCATRFSVPDDAIGASGRMVRCGACRHQWLESPPATADEGEAAPESETEPDGQVEAGPAAGEEQAGALAPAAPKAADGEAADKAAAPVLTAAAAIRPRPRPEGWQGWTVLASVVVAVVAATALLADVMIELWPPSKRLYAMVGLPFAAPGEGLEMHNITARFEDGDGGRLVIEGEIVNVSREVRPVPMVRVVLRDAQDRELADWRFRPTDVNMIPKESVSFQTSYDRPPAKAAGAALGFSSAAATSLAVPERAAAHD